MKNNEPQIIAVLKSCIGLLDDMVEGRISATSYDPEYTQDLLNKLRDELEDQEANKNLYAKSTTYYIGIEIPGKPVFYHNVSYMSTQREELNTMAKTLCIHYPTAHIWSEARMLTIKNHKVFQYANKK
jgi:hypothetical protein